MISSIVVNIYTKSFYFLGYNPNAHTNENTKLENKNLIKKQETEPQKDNDFISNAADKIKKKKKKVINRYQESSGFNKE